MTAMTARLPRIDMPLSANEHCLESDVVADGIVLRRFDVEMVEPCRLKVEGPATFCIALYVEGCGSVALENGEALEVRPGTTVLFHAPMPTRGEKRVGTGGQIRCLDFRFDPAILDYLGIPVPAVLSSAFTTDCSVGDVLLLGRPTPPALTAIARDILACRFAGPARRHYLHAKALEVLATIIAMADAPVPYTPRRDGLRIEQAKALLNERYSEAWTIARLARAVGLNEKKLKTGFRTLVGYTVHSYLEETRISAGAEMLRGGHSVTEVALSTGYANPSHFAKLFRRRYGVTPLTWRDRHANG